MTGAKKRIRATVLKGQGVRPLHRVAKDTRRPGGFRDLKDSRGEGDFEYRTSAWS